MSGWIKLHRKLLKSRAWCGADAEGKVILITLLLTACHSATRWQITAGRDIVLDPGELFISYRSFAKSCGVSVKKLTNEFYRLAVVGFLECKGKREGTIVHIKNWEHYQLPDTPLETLLGTVLDTPANPDVSGVPGEKSAVLETPKGTVLDTPLETHNKNYNNKKQNNGLQTALARYQGLFGIIPTAKLAEFVDVAVTIPDEWLVKSLDELFAANAVNRKRAPLAYWLGILRNWKASGKTEPWHKADQDSERGMMSFYASKGVNIT